MNPGLPTTEELELIRESILLPHLLDVAQNNIDQLKLQTLTFKPFLIKSVEIVMDRIHGRLVEVKKELKHRDIKVWEHAHRGDIIDYKYVVRGYHNEFPIWREHLKSELREKLDYYMKETFKGQ